MASIDVLKQKNLEGSILFMQQEHANTLRGLHEEIQKLQQRCSELTFQLAMEHTSLPQDENKERPEILQKELTQTKHRIAELEERVEKKDRRISNLEQQVKALDRKYKDELKHKQFHLTKLETELQEKCNELAAVRMTLLTTRNSGQNLTTTNEPTALLPDVKTKPSRELRKSKIHPEIQTDRNRYTPDVGLLSSKNRESSFSSHHSSHEDHHNALLSTKHNPNPQLNTALVTPGSGSSRPHSHRKSSNASKVLTQVKNRPPSGRKLLLEPQTTAASMPDETEILRIVAQQKESMDFRHGKGMVVPPIPHDAAVDASTSSSLRKLSPRNTNSAAFSKRIRPPPQIQSEKNDQSSSPEIETLAIDQVINNDLRKAHEFNS